MMLKYGSHDLHVHQLKDVLLILTVAAPRVCVDLTVAPALQCLTGC